MEEEGKGAKNWRVQGMSCVNSVENFVAKIIVDIKRRWGRVIFH